METGKQIKDSRWLTIAGLVVIVAMGAYPRLLHLGEPSVTHVEMFVPGIRLPHRFSAQNERLTVSKVLSDVAFFSTHPPAFFLMMLAWTRCFGTSEWALRLPAALLGIASIPLVFWLGILTRQRTAGWIAAALLALNGHHVFWSQVARMHTLTCFLGLLATILLLLVAKNSHPPWSLEVLYVVVLLAGLSTHLFFWAVLAAHIFWTFMTAWVRKQPFPGAGKLQFLALILGCPLLAISAYQSANQLATMSSNGLVYAREFAQFAFLFPLSGFSSGVYPKTLHVVLLSDPHLSYYRWAFVLLSLVLLFLGLGTIRKSEDKLLSDTGRVSSTIWLAAAILGTLTILSFIFAVNELVVRPNVTLRTSEWMTVLPVAIALLAIVFQKHWKRITNWSRPEFDSRFSDSDQMLVVILFAVPLSILLLVSAVKPIFNARGMLVLAPYLLLVLASGIERLARDRIAAVFLLGALSVAHYTSLEDYRQMSAGRADYKALARALAPQMDKEDLVFFKSDWYSTPILYYMSADDYHFVVRHYVAARNDAPRARVWVLWFYNYEKRIPIEIRFTVRNYHCLQTIDVPGASGILCSP